MYQNKILVGSPVYQHPEILEAFLNSLKALNCGESTIDYIFVDDNTDENASRQLAQFERALSKVTILPGNNQSAYLCDDESHHWNDSLMLRVAKYKNSIIQYALDNGYDELFFVDSDLILHPNLIMHLERQHKEVVSEIFWTKWHPRLMPEPNVWLFDEYDLVPKQMVEKLSRFETKKRRSSFLEKLKQPGLYEVGGLGACTLIKRSALQKGVSFAPINNLTIHGEDRFFCIRAAVLGIGLFIDTTYPAYHIYRKADLKGVFDYVLQCDKKYPQARIMLSMVVKNEQGRYLSRVLKSLVGHIDEAVIIDDASTDGTGQLCRDILTDIPVHLIRNKKSMFANEVSLRKMQWAQTIKRKPDWILSLDADELVEEEFWINAKTILSDPECGQCCFRLYDMWNETQYREDALWHAHQSSRTFLLRYRPNFEYQWKETPQHCGRFPTNISAFPKAAANFRIQHFGWATKKDRTEKYKRYYYLDPGTVYGNKRQYESILDMNPRLVDWQER